MSKLYNESIGLGLFFIALGAVIFFGVVWAGMTAIMWVRKGFFEDNQKDLKKTDE